MMTQEYSLSHQIILKICIPSICHSYSYSSLPGYFAISCNLSELSVFMNPDPGSFSNPSDNSQCFFCHTKTAFKIFQHKSFLSHPVHSQCIFTRIISRHFQIAYLISMLKDMRTRRNDRLLLLNYVTIYIYELSDNSIYTNELSYTPLYWHVHT